MGTGMAGLAFSGLLLMTSIVNRGVSSGSGDGLRYGRHVGSLFGRYAYKLLQQSLSPRTFGLLELGSILLATVSLVVIATGIEKRTHAPSAKLGSKRAERG